MQRIARKALSFSALSFSLLSVVAHAQLIELEPPAEGQPTAAAEAAPSPADVPASGMARTLSAPSRPAAPPSNLTTQPVAMSAGMVPAAAPAAPVAYGQAQAQVQSQSAGTTTLSGANSPTPVAASNNSNGQGTQINLNIKADQDSRQAQNQDQDSAVATGGSALGALKLEKKVREQVNEERLMEKIEEDRLDGEKARAKGIENFNFNAKTGAYEPVQTVPVTPVAVPQAAPQAAAPVTAAAPVSAPYAPMTSSAEVTTDGNGSFFGGTRFSLNPIIGYRWYQNSYPSQFIASNVITTGAGLEGTINRFLALEVNMIYAHDNFNYNNYGYGGGQAMGSRDSFEADTDVKLGYQFSSFRPFVALGVGFLYNKYNINTANINFAAAQSGYLNATTYLMGLAGVGVDYNLAKNFTIGARLDYESPFGGSDISHATMNYAYGDADSRLQLTANGKIVF